MIQIDHVAIWVHDLEAMKDFYECYFNGDAGKKYRNEFKDYESYFVSLGGRSRLELMTRPDIKDSTDTSAKEFIGLTHLAISVGGVEAVDTLTELLRSDGFEIVGEPRRTGDGYYESVVLDPEGNRVEITA